MAKDATLTFRVTKGIHKLIRNFSDKKNISMSKTFEIVMLIAFKDKEMLDNIDRMGRLAYKQEWKKYVAHQLYFKSNLRKKILTSILNNGRVVDMDVISKLITLELDVLNEYEPEVKKILIKDMKEVKRWYDEDYWEHEVAKFLDSRIKLIQHKE